MQNTGYKPITIYDLIKLRLKQVVEDNSSKRTADKTGGIYIYAVNERAKLHYTMMKEWHEWLDNLTEDILIIDITGWKKIGKTIKGKRADKLKEFCNQYKNAAAAVIVYNDANPMEQVIEAVRGILPNLQMQHFSTCNNLAGNNRALWFIKSQK